jgi:hypothetical protein
VADHHNLGFETRGDRFGTALDWTLTSSAAAEEFAGYLERENLARYSEELDQAGAGFWVANNVTVTANQLEAPDGSGNTADKISETVANDVHTLRADQTLTLDTSVGITLSCWVKRGTRRYFALAFTDAGGVDAVGFGVFDLQDSVVLGTDDDGFTTVTAAVRKRSDGWHFLTFHAVRTGAPTSSYALLLMVSDGVDVSYAGDAAQNMIVWGAQTTRARSPGPYVPTTAAGFSTSEKGFEDFESFWGANEAFLTSFDGGEFIEVQPAQYDSSEPAPLLTEPFEEGWSGNDDYLFELGSTEAAAYTGTGAAEPFESGWSTNESFLFAFVGPPTDLSAAVYEGSPDPNPDESFEDFEESWHANEDFLFVFDVSDLSAASYDVTGPVEDFEEVKLPVPIVAVDPITDTITASSHGFFDGDRWRPRGGVIPQGLNVGNEYFIVSATTHTFQAAATFGGAPIDLMSPGGGALLAYGDPGLWWTLGMTTL